MTDEVVEWNGKERPLEEQLDMLRQLVNVPEGATINRMRGKLGKLGVLADALGGDVQKMREFVEDLSALRKFLEWSRSRGYKRAANEVMNALLIEGYVMLSERTPAE